MNGVFEKEDLIGLIHPRYNVQRLYFDFAYNDFIKIRKPSYHYSKKDYGVATGDSITVQFTICFMSGTRPWNEDDNHPYKQEYLEYRSMTSWHGVPLWADDRKKERRL